MKVLLRRDVEKLGYIGEVVEVSAGYARNYLMPQRLAMPPTKANLKALEYERKSSEHARLERRERLSLLAVELDKSEVTISALANEQGHLFGSVGRRDIAAALAEQGYDVPRESIVLPEAIRELDKRTVEVRLAPDLVATVDVWVVPEKEAADGEPASAEQPTDEPDEA